MEKKDRYRQFKSLYYVVYIFIFACILCNFIYILSVIVLVTCIFCIDNFDPMIFNFLKKSFWQIIELKFKESIED